MHAGSENGWIDGADLVFQSKKATGDYHDEMNSNNFEEWFHDKLLSNIKDNSLIIMDNASYHSRRIEKVPTSNTRKSEMQDWLTSHGIEYPERALKHELLSLIKLSNPKPKYVIDEMAKTAGHEVVRIPPYHCELNPIELCWSQVKRYIKEHNKEFTLTDANRLIYDGFNKVGTDEWKKNIKHVKNAEEYYWEADNLQEDMPIGEFTIRIDDDSDSDDEGNMTDDSLSIESSDDD